MDADFWHGVWARNALAFHEGQANAMMAANFGALSLAPGSRVFVPLCGKTRDIAWLLSQGYRVAGAELSRVAVEQLFAELGAEPMVETAGPLLKFSAQGVEVFVGDIFDLTAETLGAVDAVYDRAALVALPENLRGRYGAQMTSITGAATQLLICFEYVQSAMPGPPFSIDAAEVGRVYGANHSATPLARVAVKGLLKGICPATETAWLLA